MYNIEKSIALFYVCRVLHASLTAEEGLGVGSLRPSVCPPVHSNKLVIATPLKLLSDFHETWYVDRTSYVVVHIARKCCSPDFNGRYSPWNLENNHK